MHVYSLASGARAGRWRESCPRAASSAPARGAGLASRRSFQPTIHKKHGHQYGGDEGDGDALTFASGKWMPTAMGLQTLMPVGMHGRPFTVATANSGWQQRLGGHAADYTVPRLHFGGETRE